tara:strand:- start:69 stop:893 length:825 start_codon:yes stop_codon:yes gene_type:complete
MKILIPFSGGMNSTYSLYRWLTETDAEVVARYSFEKFSIGSENHGDDEYNAAEFKKVQDIVLFLKSEIRDFNFQQINWTKDYVKEIVPIREGFKLGKYDIGAIAPRYEGFYQWIKETNVDGFSFGVSLENSATDHGYLGTKKLHQRKIVENTGADIYLAGTKDLSPVPIGDDFDPDIIIKELTGRFEQYDFLPEELQNLVLKCNSYSCKKEKCRNCAYQRTYEKFVDEGKIGRDFDLYCAKQGSYGPWRHEADPETYLYRGRGKDGKLPYLLYE